MNVVLLWIKMDMEIFNVLIVSNKAWNGVEIVKPGKSIQFPQ